jgi:hypothetical protein
MSKADDLVAHRRCSSRRTSGGVSGVSFDALLGPRRGAVGAAARGAISDDCLRRVPVGVITAIAQHEASIVVEVAIERRDRPSATSHSRSAQASIR